MLNREDVREVLVARDKVVNIYKEQGIEIDDISNRKFLEDIIKEVAIKGRLKSEKKDTNN